MEGFRSIGFHGAALGPRACAVCRKRSGLMSCGGCKVESYCGAAHQLKHRPQHKDACNAIKKTREKLAHEEAELRANPGDSVYVPKNVFDSGVGKFGSFPGTQDYMRARFIAANALLKVETTFAVGDALIHFKDMLRLCRDDNQSVRDIVPWLLLRLGREQECYDFIKWYATVDERKWGDMTLPYLNVHGANVSEPVSSLRLDQLSLGHLAALTLLKVRLYMDFSTYDVDSPLDRPVGALVQECIKAMHGRLHNGFEVYGYVSEMADTLKSQYKGLCDTVQKKNSFFWEALVEDEEPPPPQSFSPGSKEETDLVLHQCLRAWQESKDAISMVDEYTVKYTHIYPGSTGSETTEKRRGTGSMFPSTFQLPYPTFTPAELFPITSRGQDNWYTSLTHPKVLVYIDGACPNNGQAKAQGGWAVVYGVPPRDIVSGRLEDTGPFGESSTATSNRAELRAAIAALRMCDWRSKGFQTLVLATDSSYVVDGATNWTKGWMRNGWTTRIGHPVRNRDLWEMLLGEVERWDDHGLDIELWKIPREQNFLADAAAKQAAATEAAEAMFRDVQIDDQPRRQLNGLLILTTENAGLADACFGTLLTQIATRAPDRKRATTPEDALKMLAQEPPPSTIVIADAGPARQRKVWESVIDHLRAGATVVLAGCFSSNVTQGEFDRFFARLGLPWTRGSYYRETVLLSSGVDGEVTRHLPSAYSQKAQFVKGVDRSAVWYAESETSDEAAVVFARVGAGQLGYIGDVNGEAGSNTAVLAMCGLATRV